MKLLLMMVMEQVNGTCDSLQMLIKMVTQMEQVLVLILKMVGVGSLVMLLMYQRGND